MRVEAVAACHSICDAGFPTQKVFTFLVSSWGFVFVLKEPCSCSPQGNSTWSDNALTGREKSVYTHLTHHDVIDMRTGAPGCNKNWGRGFMAWDWAVGCQVFLPSVGGAGFPVCRVPSFQGQAGPLRGSVWLYAGAGSCRAFPFPFWLAGWASRGRWASCLGSVPLRVRGSWRVVLLGSLGSFFPCWGCCTASPATRIHFAHS